jgi:hypothetical protein
MQVRVQFSSLSGENCTLVAAPRRPTKPEAIAGYVRRLTLSSTEIEEYFGRFFVLQEGFLRGALRVTPARKLRVPDELTRRERTPRKPVRFERDEGSRPLDLVGTTFGPLTIVSRRVIDVLERERFAGWATYPVELDTAGIDADAYHGLAVHGRCGNIDNSLTPKRLLPPPVPEGEAVPGRRGLLFEHGSWDGSDLFCPSEGATIFVTREVRDALVAAKVKNLDFQCVTEVERI